MDDEKLRELIDEIRSCRFTKDKITIIHNEVKSLDDLVQILNNCIWEDELGELVNNLTKYEIEVLKYYLVNRNDDNLNDLEMLRRARVSFAMENGNAEVLRMCKYKTNNVSNEILNIIEKGERYE